MPQDNIAKGVVLIVITTLVASTAAAATKYIAGSATVEQIVFFQYFISFILVTPLVRGATHLEVRRGDRWAMFIRAVSGLLAFYTYYLAIREISLVEATLLRTSSPLFIPLLAFLWLHTRVRGHDVAALCIGFIGIFIILNPTVTLPGIGHAFGILSAIAVSLSVVSTRRLAADYSPQTILIYHYFISAVGMLPLAIYTWQDIPLSTWPYILYIGASVHVALYLYTRALTFASANVIAPLIYLSVVFAGLFDWLLWDQTPGVYTMVGMAVVIAAGIAATWYSSQQEDSGAKV